MAVNPLPPGRHYRRGVALVIVLAFVVLLTGVIIAYFTRAMDNRSLSSSSFNQAGSDELARSALDIVVSDVEQEIINGSTPSTGLNAPSNSPTIYLPTEAAYMVPARNGTPPTPAGSPNPLPTLLRISAPPANLASSDTSLPSTYSQLGASGPGVDHPAFPNALSTTPSVNGRAVTPARWNQHFLLPCKTPTDSGADSTPISTSDNPPGFAAPRWVYVNGQGPIAPASASALPTGAIGRYAYAMYDESALLDVNVAGLPAAAGTSGGMSPSQAQIVGKKGTVRFADLTQLPGAPDTSKTPPTPTYLSSAQAANIVGWRNYASVNLTGTFGAFAFTGSPMDRYIAEALGSPAPGPTPTPGSTPNEYLKVNSTLWNGGTDQAFLTRQQLLNFQKSSGGFSAVALQYLGTFSRALTAPTWIPYNDSTNLPGYPTVGDAVLQGTVAYPYHAKAESTTTTASVVSNSPSSPSGISVSTVTVPNPNRDIGNIRWPTSATITHYEDDGTPTTVSVNAGDPFVQHRFPLDRINWLTHTGVASGKSAQAVLDCFGLQWGNDKLTPSHACWVYVAGVTSTVAAPNTPIYPMVIMTLDQVAALPIPREPNFFELLKAGILNGSLGKTPGKLVDYMNYSYGSAEGPGGAYFDVAEVSPDMQILQIGANIIDQWDTDSFPTAIYFPGAVPGMPIFPTAPGGSPDAQYETSMANIVYGVENLPYLNCLFNIAWYTNQDQQLVAPPPSSPDKRGRIDGWFQPELWDPFQVLNSATNPNAATASSRPAGFCVRAYGEVEFSYSCGGGDGTCDANGTIERYDKMADGGPTEACVYFSDSVPSSFANPSLLTQTNGGNYSKTVAINIAPASNPNGETQNQVKSNPFLAIHTGFADFGFTPDPTKAGAPNNPSWECCSADTGAFLVCNNEPYPDYQTNGGVANNSNPPPGVTFCMQYLDPATGLYYPYSYASRYNGWQSINFRLTGDGSNPALNPIYGSWEGGSMFGHSDPLTDRFSSVFTDSSHAAVYTPWGYSPNGFNQSWENWQTSGFNNPVAGVGGEWGGPRSALGFKYWQDGANLFTVPANVANPGNSANQANYAWARGYYLGNFAQNNVAVDMPGGPYAIYADNDGVVRAGNDYLWNPANNTTGLDASGNSVGFANGDGMSQLPGGYSTGTGTGATPSTTVGRRPLILNRPFQSVAELGYAYRDLPFKSLDMFSPYSADSALLDLFCIQEEPTITAGRINPNDAPAPVIQAIIGGANKEELDPTYIVANTYNGKTTNEATLVATNIATTLAPQAPQPTPTPGATPAETGIILTNRADLVKLMNNQTGIPSAFVNSADKSDKTFVEAPIRALSDVTNTRTWNLMVDVIAQSGLLAPGATTANQFVVQGESRYWLHFAIDRFTGKIVDQQLEQVSE